MISLNLINNLTEEEFALICFGLTKYCPPRPILEVDKCILSAYKPEALYFQLENNVKPNLNESGQLIFNSVLNKLFPHGRPS